ncbi:hypothetical protein J3A83DRAFT_4194794 [Scleroderma citrinum]
MLSISFLQTLSRLFVRLLRVFKDIPRIIHGTLFRLIQTTLRLRSTAMSSAPNNKSCQPSTICGSSAPIILSQLHGSAPFSTTSVDIGSSNGNNGVAVPPHSNSSGIVDISHSDPPLENRDLAQRNRITAAPGNTGIAAVSVLRGASPDEFMCRRFSSRATVALEVDGWLRCTQPEGALYYIYQEKNIVTDVSNPEKRNKALDICKGLLETARSKGLPLHPDVQLVVGYFTAQKQREWGYYFVDHRQQLLFWDKQSQHSTGNSLSLLGAMHVELYPNLLELKAEHHEELKNILIQAMADATTSGSPLAPYEPDTLGRMLELANTCESSIGTQNTHAVWVTGMSTYETIYGQRYARLNADQSIYNTRHSRGYSPSRLIRIFDLVLFGSASIHAEELERAWVDKIIHYPRWKAYISKLNTEWSNFTFYVCRFLVFALPKSLIFSSSIPALGGGGGNAPALPPPPSNDTSSAIVPPPPPTPPTTSQQTAAIAAIYLSILFVVGALVTSIQLTDHTRGKEHSSAAEAGKVLQRTAESWLGTDGLAITFSLPYALLIWGIILFVLSMSLVIYASSSHPMLIVIAPIMFILVIFAIWPSVGSRGYFSGAVGPWRSISEWKNMTRLPFLQTREQSSAKAQQKPGKEGYPKQRCFSRKHVTLGLDKIQSLNAVRQSPNAVCQKSRILSKLISNDQGKDLNTTNRTTSVPAQTSETTSVSWVVGS